MAIYRYYYGANAGSGIGIQAISKQLENLAIRSDLKDLASMHALESTDHDGGMLSYLLQRDEYSVLGLSYIESAKSSGYGRSAPCGLQYIVPAADMKNASFELGGIVNFISFQKPASASPSPLSVFPLNENGYYYHNSPAILAPLVDGLVRVALSKRKEVLLVALPKGKSNEYATARYTIAEALNYLPVPLRQKIHFFTGLPVEEGVTDALVGYDNAVKYNANVIFCPNEHFEKLKGYRSFIGLDMDRPGEHVGAFADYITQMLTPAEELSMIASCLNGPLTYDSLNQAAQKVQRGELMTMNMLKESLEKSEKRCQEYERHIDAQYRELENLQNAYDALQNQQQYYTQNVQWEENNSHKKGKRIIKRILWILGIILLMALTGFVSWMVATFVHTGHFFPVKEPSAVTTDASDKNDTLPEATVDTTALQETGEQANTQDNTTADAVDANEKTEDQPASTETPVSNEAEVNQTEAEPAVTVTETPAPAQPEVNQPAEEPAITATETPAPAQPEMNQAEEEPQVTETEIPASLPEQQEENNAEEDAEAETEVQISSLGVNNRYGITNTRVNFREGNNKSAGRIKELGKDTKVWMVKTEQNDAGEQWTEVYVDGQNGYIKTEFLDMMSQEESDAYISAQPSPVPEEMYADIVQ